MRAETDYAWAAGFIDGEGWFGTNRTKLRLQVQQSDRRVLDKLAEILGGKVYGPYTRKDGYNQKPHFLFQVSGTAEVLECFAHLRPYLSEVKKKQLRMARLRIKSLTPRIPS